MMRFRNIPVLATCILTAVSCLSSTTTDDRQAAVEFIPVLGNDVRSESISTNFPEDMDFGVWAITEDGSLFMDRERISHTDGRWLPCTPYVWPAEKKLRFIAYAPYDYKGIAGNGRSISIDDCDLSSAETELYMTGVTQEMDKTGGAAVLSFHPVTSKIDFRIANGMNMASSVRLEKILLCGVSVKGSFDSSEETQWTLSGNRQDLTAYDSSTDGETGDVSREASYFGKTLDVIPQNSRPVIRLVFSVSSSGSGWAPGQIMETEPLETGWEPGRKYTYTLTITENKLKFTTGINNWAGNNEE